MLILITFIFIVTNLVVSLYIVVEVIIIMENKINRNEYIRKQMKALRNKRKQNNLCQDCGKLPPEAPYLLCENCREERRIRNHIYDKKRRDNARKIVYSHYGNKCVCCGCDIPEFLTIDHINNGGHAHRRSLGISSTYNFNIWLIKNSFPDEFQILCYNCNCGRYKNNGICPHKKHIPLSI